MGKKMSIPWYLLIKRVIVFVIPITVCQVWKVPAVNKPLFSQRVRSTHVQPASALFERQDGSSQCAIPGHKYPTTQNNHRAWWDDDLETSKAHPPTIEYCFLNPRCQSSPGCFIASRTFWEGIWLQLFRNQQRITSCWRCIGWQSRAAPHLTFVYRLYTRKLEQIYS